MYTSVDYVSKKRMCFIAFLMVFSACVMMVLPVSSLCAKEPSDMNAKAGKVFSDEAVGFSFQYDSRWAMKTIEQMTFFILSRVQSPYIIIAVYTKPLDDATQSLREIVDAILEEQVLFEKPKFKKDTINGCPTLLVSGPSQRHVGTDAAYYFIKKDSILITFTLTGVAHKQWEKYKENFDAVLSSIVLK